MTNQSATQYIKNHLAKYPVSTFNALDDGVDVVKTLGEMIKSKTVKVLATKKGFAKDSFNGTLYIVFYYTVQLA